MEEEEVEGSLGPFVVLGLVGAVVVLLLLAAGVWGVGKIISRIRESGQEEDEIVVDQDQDDVAEEDTGDIEGEEEEGDIAGEGDTDTSDDESDEQDTEDQESAEEESDNTDEGTEGSESGRGLVHSLSEWVANNYESGDIKGKTYKVVWGDTLWEISEARYGNGYDWVKIRDANSSDIGLLPNGSQALIVPGQILELPE